jgi:two-component system, NarL family, sensor kinase
MDTRIVIVISAALFSLLVISFLFRFILLYQKKTAAFETEKRLIETRFQQELLSAQLEIQEQTLEHVSQEIHDNIGQTLSLAKLTLNRLDVSNPTPGIDHTKDMLTKAIADLRAVSKSLNTGAILSAGLLKAIESELKQLEKSGAYTTRLETSETQSTLKPQHELILFRIVQEALNNIIKHAEASSVIIRAEFRHQELALSIADNGKGFMPPADVCEGNEGIGLRNMCQRTKLLQGSFCVESIPGNGTSIHLLIPIA